MSRKQNNSFTFADLIIEKVCPTNKFLEEMNEVVPWEEFEKFFNKHLPRTPDGPGRPPYPLILLFRIHLLQQWYDLSDEKVEFMIYDSLSFRKFLNLRINQDIPDSTTIENFRHLMEEKGWDQKLIKLFDAYSIRKGLIKKESNIVDATFLRANSRPTKTEEKKTDIDAEFGYKGYGYSATINMDSESKLVRKTNTTSAKLLDHQSVEEVLIGDEKELEGDKGYAPARENLERVLPDCKVKVMYKRTRGKKNEPPKELHIEQKKANKVISKTRARVEHPFGIIKNDFGFTKLRYRGLERVSAKTNSLALAYNLKRLGYLVKRKPALKAA
jgi:IS5 family transposase